MGGGKGDDSGSKAADAQVRANNASIAEMRRQFGITQENIAPWLTAGQDALGVTQESATPQGLDALLAQIMGTDTFGSLVDERQRGVQGQLAAGGLTRSGTAMQEAARVPTDLALALENMLTGRQSGISSTGASAAVGLGNLGQSNSSGIAGLMSQSGNAISSGIITDQQARAQGQQNLFNTAATIGSKFMDFMDFSDPRLKENVEQVSSIHDLGVYQWDWKAETKGTLIDGRSNIGFMADEVQEKYPHHVGEFGGFMVIDYPALLNELEAKNIQEAA